MRGDILVAVSTKLVMKKYSLIMFVLALITLVLSACGGKGPLPPADTNSPSISLTSPTNGAQSVSVSSSITITFSEAMDASTINERTITLSMGTGNVPGSVTYSDMTAVFKPASSLDPETIYTVTVDGGVKDVAGNAMVTPVGFIFITGTVQSPTTTTITAPAVTYGANGIVTVTVSSATGTPTGNVSLTIDGGTAVVHDLTSGSTTFTIPSPSAGSHALNAAYAAQGNFGASLASGTLIVSKASTSTGVTSSLNPSTSGDLVTFTATVAPSTATGTVTFKDNTTVLGTGTLSGGVAKLSTSALSVASHSITAVYSSDTNFASSTSSTLTQTVQKRPH